MFQISVIGKTEAKKYIYMRVQFTRYL